VARRKGGYAQAVFARTKNLYPSTRGAPMTTLIYRGIAYSMEEEHRAFSNWWTLVHRPGLWLKYRGQKYRPCQIDKSGWQSMWSSGINKDQDAS
jgi:hypothetical protein